LPETIHPGGLNYSLSPEDVIDSTRIISPAIVSALQALSPFTGAPTTAAHHRADPHAIGHLCNWVQPATATRHLRCLVTVRRGGPATGRGDAFVAVHKEGTFFIEVAGTTSSGCVRPQPTLLIAERGAKSPDTSTRASTQLLFGNASSPRHFALRRADAVKRSGQDALVAAALALQQRTRSPVYRVSQAAKHIIPAGQSARTSMRHFPAR